jgi:hypothetical protein
MLRLFFLALLVGVVILAITSVMAAVALFQRAEAPDPQPEDKMPTTVRTVAYVALILLLLGLTSGLIGGA